MKKLAFAGFPLLAAAILVFNNIHEPLPIGAPIPKPEVKLKDISGKEVSFTEAQKKNGLLVMFSCNTCPVVRKYQSRTLAAAALAAKNDIGVVLLNSNTGTRDDGDSFDDMKAYGKRQAYNFFYVLDDNSVMADAFGANRTPEVFLFNKDKKLVYHGAIDDNANGEDQVSRKHLTIAIDELIGGKEISMKETRSVGVRSSAEGFLKLSQVDEQINLQLIPS
jgi:Redoxin